MKRVSLIIFFCVMLASTTFAQHSKKAEKAYKAAEEAFFKRNYQKAHKQAVKAIIEDHYYAEAWLLEGEIGMETQDYDLAIMGYEKALASDSMAFPSAAITLARLYDLRGSYRREMILLRWYQSKKLGQKDNDATVAEMLDLATFRDWALQYPVDFDPVNLGDMVNTKDDEYVNMLSFDGSQLLFTCKIPMGDGYYKEYLFVSQRDGVEWYESQLLDFSDFPDNVDPGAAFISADGRKLYLTGCGWSRGSSCDIYVSEWNDGRWGMPKRLEGSINTSNWESQPCVSGDGRELFFVSRRSGNADIYRSVRNADGTWSEPQNLGEPINTIGTEMAPFLHPDGHTLYFSSDKHVGMGGYDLFMSRRGEDGQWQAPVNLGFPINTSGDEINFFVSADGKTAFISSQREGGMGGYDIYTFELPDEIRSDSANYLSSVDVTELSPGDAIVLQNIYFEYNRSVLTLESEEGIQMIADFLQHNPDLKVELAGHTDNVGRESYNLKLSKNRAIAVRNALISKGIDKNRLIAKGYGTSRPVSPNDTEEHRALNRRTEMIIID